jgi:phosphopantetheine--protein transferase-like protein
MKHDLQRSVDELNSNNRFAVGNDLVYMPNFLLSLTDAFKKRVYSPAEVAYCEQFSDAALRYASTWAAKEAVYKAIKQLDKKPLSWKKIEITRDKIAGRPHVKLHQHERPFKISLSISHDGDYIWAVALIEADH